MVLSSIHLKNFRKHSELSLNFSNKINYLIGNNGIGKTTVLEAIYYLCTTKGYKTKSDAELITFKEKQLAVEGVFTNQNEQGARIYYDIEGNGKNYFLNGKRLTRNIEIIGKFPAVLLTPEDHAITQGQPAYRRRLVDSTISQANRLYLETLLDYNKTLRQRSFLLRKIKERRSKQLIEELDAWTTKLVESGLQLINHRKVFIVEFNEYISRSYKDVIETNENPKVTYSCLDDYKGEDIKERFAEQLKEKQEEEIRRTTNLVGPHRDDYIFELNGYLLRYYGSQGQHKTFQIALKYTQYLYLKEKIGEEPIFLLDDVFGELDTDRAIKISNLLRHAGQTFITVTDFSNLSFINRDNNDSFIRMNERETVYA